VNERTIAATIVAAGIALAGFLAGNGLAKSRAADRYVTVKGVTEREVRADLAIWPIHVVTSDNDLAAAHKHLEASVVGVRQFLAANGLDTTGLSLSGFAVNDAQANEYGGDRRVGNRFILKQTLILRSSNVDKVVAASQRVADLASAGVNFSSGQGEGGETGGGPTFIFSGLNGLKPQMIADATARAHEAAEQFARDSHSALGGIRQANQGVFEILPRDEAPGLTEGSQVSKRVRVVSTVDYFLKN
jgi:hypothetical protein